jgi:simple sugar transport system ATP-binding protein
MTASLNKSINEGAASAAPIPRVLMKGIKKRFGSIEAIRGVDLALYPGECVGLVGDNAAGKSTLTKILAGAYEVDEGQIFIDGTSVKFKSPSDARNHQIEMVYQDLSLCDTIDVAGNLYLGREPMTGLFLDRKAMRQGAREMLDRLKIKISNLDQLVAQLSGGQRQAIAICRAAAFNPKVLIMDEPTSALAVAEVEAVLSLINRVKSTGVTVVLITHRLQDLFRVCDRIAVMYEGTKVAERQITQTNLQDLISLIVGGSHELLNGDAPI